MEILKRIVRAVVYSIVGGLGGGIGAVVGSAPGVFTAGIYFGILMGGVTSSVSVVIIFFGIIGVCSNKEVLESVFIPVETFLMTSLPWVVVFSLLYFLKYAVRGAAMGMVRGARGGALGGRLGGAINGMVEGTMYGFGLWAIGCGIIKIFLRLLKKNRESFCGEDFWWITLIFTLFFALLGLIVGASNGAEKYASKGIQKNDRLKDFSRSIFKYALRTVQLDDQGKVRTVQRFKASFNMMFFSPLRFRAQRNKQCDDPSKEK